MIGLELRKVTEKDWKILKCLETDAESEFFHALKKESEIRNYIKNSKVFFIVLNNKEIGTVSIEEIKKRFLNFNGLTVKKEFRRKGIGSWAIRKVLEKVEHKKIDLVVHPANTPAIIVYLRAGFVIKNWKDDFFNDGTPRLVMSKK